MTRPRLLDLFCGAGGSAVGYHRAGFDVVGVDIRPQPRYPFEFVQADAIEYMVDYLKHDVTRLVDFDAIHASPPCQRYSVLARRNGNAASHPDLVGPTRELLQASQVPYVIENVEGAPLRGPIVLCGTSFPGLRVIRHRLFESSAPLTQPPTLPHPLVYTRDKRKRHYGKLDEWRDFVMVNGGGNCSRDAALDAMGITWPMTKHEVNEAIPPAYTEWVGRQLLMTIDRPTVRNYETCKSRST